MSGVAFSKEETAVIVGRLQAYFRDELDQEIGALPAQMLLDFLGREIGPFFYNRALYDAQAVVAERMDAVGEAVLGLEKRAG